MPTLRDNRPGAGGEVQLTGVLREVMVHGGRVLAVPLAIGQHRHDIGSLESCCAAFLLDG